MKKIRVLHLSSEKTWRGGEQQIAYLIDELRLAGHENVVAVRKNSTFERYCEDNNIPFFSLPFSSSLNFKTALAVKAICKAQKIDILHLHSSKSHSIGVLAALFGNKTPLILSRRIDFVPSRGFFTQWKYDHDAIKKIICVSDKVRDIVESYCNRKHRTVTVYDGIDVKKFLPLPQQNVLRREFQVPDSAFIVGNTSALEGHKDYFTFIKTIGHLKKMKVQVVAFIIGKGSLEHHLKNFTEAEGLSDTIRFTGFRTDIREVLPALNVFLMTSNEEGLGSSILDAFAARVPVVATRAGGIPEMIVDNENGLLADIGDAAALASHVKTIIDNGALRNRLVDSASRTLEKFSKQVMGLQTESVYREVLQLKG